MGPGRGDRQLNKQAAEQRLLGHVFQQRCSHSWRHSCAPPSSLLCSSPAFPGLRFAPCDFMSTCTHVPVHTSHLVSRLLHRELAAHL